MKGDDVKVEDYNEKWEKITKLKKHNVFRAVFLSDSELVTLVNNKMESIWEKDKVFTYRTFQRYKAKVVENIDDEKEYSEDIIELFKLFCRVIEKHLVRQKEMLFQRFVDETIRTKYARIIERKFWEWNLKNISQIDQKVTEHNIIVKTPTSW